MFSLRVLNELQMQPSTLSHLSFYPGTSAKQITFLPQLMNKEKSLTTYPANQKILST